MAFDFKKEFKEFYLPTTKPAIMEVPVMNYLAVRGKGCRASARTIIPSGK